MVGCVRKLNHVKLLYSPRTVFSRSYSTYYDPAAMNEDFKNVNWWPIYVSIRNVNTAVKLFNEIVKDIFDRHAPEIV